MAEPRSAAQEAGDPSTSPERLLALTEKHPQLHRLIVLNPSCPEVARQWILATNPWARRAHDEAHGEHSAAEADEELGTEAPEAGDPGAEEHDEGSVWGDLGTGSAASVADTAPQEIPEPAPTSTVRIAEDSAVVPLGSPSGAPAAAWTYDAPPAPGAHPPAATPGVGIPPTESVPPTEGTPDQDDGSRSGRRAWYACGGCLLLALVLVVVMALVGRAWLTGDDEEYQRDSSTTAEEESPSAQPTEEPTEQETTPDPVSPAPEDAREMTELRSPTGNISCLLEEDSVSCSVLEHDYSGSGVEGCEAGPFSITVAEGDPARACGSSFLSEEGTTLEYGDSASFGNMACTSRFDGMTCWNTLTGKGFMVNRATYETF